MARVKLNFPFNNPIYTAQIPLRITDMNYGNHLGNDAVLSVMHEARVQLLTEQGYSELEIGGCGLLMADVAVVYKSEGFYGDILSVEIFINEISTSSFELMYKMYTLRNGERREIAHAKTGMVCFDYAHRKVCRMPDLFRKFLERIVS